jgi:Carbohydrate binding domain
MVASWMSSLTSRRSQPPLALAVPLSRFTSRVGGGSAFFVRRFTHFSSAQTPSNQTMKTKLHTTPILALLALGASACCALGAPMSETFVDKAAGMNGSFEVTKSGLPVNWLFYTKKTVPSGDFDIVTDTKEYKDGKQSLKFVVRKCSNVGGRLSPGFCQEFQAKPGETYKVSFWVKNSDSEFFVRVGGVSAFNGEYKTVVKSKEKIGAWRQFSIKYTVPKGMKALRFEMNILQPGTFWIDDLKIEKVTN